MSSAVAVSVTVLAGVLLACLSDFPLRFLMLNADALYLPIVFRDLFEFQGRWAAWYLTPAPYLFPDYLLFLPAYLLGESVFHQILIYAMLQLALMTLAVWWLARRAGCRSAYWPAILFTAAMAYLAIVYGQPYLYVLMSAFHCSVFLFALWAAAQCRSPGARGAWSGSVRLGILCGACFLVALSDALVMVQVVLPIAMWLLLRTWTRELPLRDTWRWIVLPGLAGFAGMLAYRFVVPNGTRPASRLDLYALAPRWMEAWSVVRTEFAQWPILVGSLTLFYLFAIYCLAMQLARRPSRAPPAISSLASLALLTAVVNLSATLVLTKVGITPRYFIPLTGWPFAIVALWLGLSLRRRSWLLVLPASFAAAGLFSSAVAGVEQHGIRRDFYPQDIACIDAALDGTDLKYGMAQYWDAKYLVAFSRHELQLAQYLSNLSEFRWITTARNYRETYDFAIVTQIMDIPGHRFDAETVRAVAGAPRQTVQCEGRTLLIYGRDGLRLTGVGKR